MALGSLGRHSARTRRFFPPLVLLFTSWALCIFTNCQLCLRDVLLPQAFAQLASRPTLEQQVKQRLRQDPEEAAILQLEKSWRPVEAVSDVRQLQGSWTLAPPQGNRGSLSNDLPRMLLNLYVGNIGRMLSMELVSPPQLHIDSHGRTRTETELRWGRQRDRILLQGQLQIAGPNRLRETPKTTRSSSLQLTLPAMQQERDIKVTYFDKELLIMRDGRGIVDVWWRVEALPADHAKEKLSMHVAPPAALPKSSVLHEDKLQMQVETLSASLQALHNQSKQDHEARKELSAHATRLEKRLEEAEVDSRADSVTLGAITKLKSEVSKDFQMQEQKSETKERGHEDLKSEVARLQQKCDNLEVTSAQYKLQESSLKKQISILEAEFNTGARDAWPAYRAAVAKAKQDLAGVRRNLKTSLKEGSTLKRDLMHKSADLKRMKSAVDVELAARKVLEAQIEEQQREYQEATGRLEHAAHIEKALREELTSVRNELQGLEEREAESKRVAAEMEEELQMVAQQVKVAKQAIKGLSSEKKRRIWPWR
eukprot:TRINITY_DN331_c0_g2_i1.p1 TRINITY_DN331_c0_g2~~TRINITY_DN331_c0_g2_i1.p1  ORF type:complete len:562 (-),score=134.42 TRINITY_DN331_c0_g2_i1:137-1753(-)